MSWDEGASFGEALKRFRTAAGLTQEELAERSGLSVRGISDLERGVNRFPRRDTLYLIIDALKLSEEDREALCAAWQRRGPPIVRAHRYPFPAPATPLLGREREMASALTLLRRADLGLLTMVGPGGVGKTRLALELAHNLHADFTDGVCFVSLSQIRDTYLVAPEIAQALGVREAGNQTIAERLRAVLEDKRLLLVLDTFEHVLESAPFLASLLSTCSRLKILVTSRAVLHLSSEHVFWVPPLDLPPLPEQASGEELARSPAVRLFAMRAEAARSDFTLAPEVVPQVAAICTRLDGLPLSIELAAARIGHLSPAALLGRLDRLLPMLTGGAADQPDRLRSIRNSVAWSYDLLVPEERSTLRKLAVFAGGFDLEAAEAVAGVDLDQIASLVDKSVVLQSDHGDPEPRYEMMEPVRETGLEQLAASGEETALREAHAAFFFNLAERAAPELTGPQQVVWLNRLETELNNFRVSLSWMLDRGQAEQGLRMAVALSRFWDYHSHLSEGQHWLNAALALDPASEIPVALRAQSLRTIGLLARTQGDFDRAQPFLDESLRLFREVGDPDGAGFALNSLGTLALYQGKFSKAKTMYKQGLALLRDVGNQDGVAAILANLGYAALLGDQFAEAAAYCEQSLAIYRCVGSRLGSANTLGILGRAVLEQGDRERATKLLRESLSLNQGAGNKWYLAECLEGLAAVATLEGRPVRATRLFAAASALCEKIRVNLPEFDRTTNERYLAQVRDQLDEDNFSAAWKAGWTLPLDEVIAEALDIDNTNDSES